MTLEEKLAEAEAAYHSLMLGQSAKVFVDQNGERIEYNTASSSRLSAYIQELKRQLAIVTSGPMQIFM